MVKHKAEHQAYNKFCLVYDARNTIKCLKFMNLSGLGQLSVILFHEIKETTQVKLFLSNTQKRKLNDFYLNL